MEPPKWLIRSRILLATTENYRELISSPGNTLVMYAIRAGIYACDRRIRQAFRSIAEDYPPNQLNVVLVDMSQCRTDPDKIDTTPRFRLFRDGQELLPLRSRHSKGEWVRAWLTELIGPAPMKEGEIIRFHKCDLPHGVQLEIWNNSGRVTVREVADFLAEAMEHFKHHRDKLKTGLYTRGSYVAEVKQRRRVLGTLRLSCAMKEGITAELWTQAVIHAYTRTNSVEDMLEDLPAWQKAVETKDGHLRDVVGMLDKPGGDLLAVVAMIGSG